jgi:hypothetical protein
MAKKSISDHHILASQTLRQPGVPGIRNQPVDIFPEPRFNSDVVEFPIEHRLHLYFG